MNTTPPNETAPAKSKWKSGCLIAAGVFVGLGILGAAFGDKQPTASTDKAATTSETVASSKPAAPPANNPTMSMAEFEQIKNGMTIDEVTEIVGGKGKLLSESEIAGISGQMFQFEGEGGFGANANVQLQNGKVIMKSQFGLE